jgi:hypothetical protein
MVSRDFSYVFAKALVRNYWLGSLSLEKWLYYGLSFWLGLHLLLIAHTFISECDGNIIVVFALVGRKL